MTVDVILWMAVRQFVQLSILILIIAGIVKLIGRKARPQLAYLLWTLALVKCLTPPLWSSPTGVFSWSLAYCSPPIVQATLDSVNPTPPVESQSPSPSNPILLPGAHNTAAQPSDSYADQLRSSVVSESPYVVLLLIWMVPAFLMLIIAEMRLIRLWRKVDASSRLASVDLRTTLEDLVKSLQIPASVRLRVADDDIGPALIGFIRPMIVLPRFLTSQSERSRLRQAVAHELAHLSRRDHWVSALQLLAQSIWWFNPLVWWMNSQINFNRELCCDERVIVSLGCPPADYAQMLLNVLKHRGSWQRAGFSLGVQPMQITRQRLQHVMSNPDKFRKTTPWACWLTAAIGAALLLPGAAVVLRGAAATSLDPVSLLPATQSAKPISLVGRAIDAITDKPIVGAKVRVYRLVVQTDGYNFAAIAPPSEYVTDSHGLFTVDIPADQAAYGGNFCLATEAFHPDYADVIWSYAGLTLIQRERAEGDPYAELEEDMYPAQQVSGRVVDPNGDPVADTEVTYRSEDLPGAPLSALSWALGTVKTDDRGFFHYGAIKGTRNNQFTVRPPDDAVLNVQLGDHLGDQGVIKLKPGFPITGRVVDLDGNPIADQVLNIRVGDNDFRDATTDSLGKFRMDPLEPGQYKISVEGPPPDRTNGSMIWNPSPATFVPTVVNLPPGGLPAPIEIRPVSDATIIGKALDTQGKPEWNFESSLSGKFGGVTYFAQGRNTPDGTMRIRVPKGLEAVSIDLIYSDRKVMQFQLGTGPWTFARRIKFDRINSDTKISIRFYDAPQLTVRAVDPQGKSITINQPEMAYVNGAFAQQDQPNDNREIYVDQGHDGSWHTIQLAPDQDFSGVVSAPGYQNSVIAHLSLREGEKRDITLHLKPAAMAPAIRP